MATIQISKAYKTKINDKSDDPVFLHEGMTPYTSIAGLTHDEIERRKLGAMTPIERGRILML